MKLLEALNWRYATKRMSGEKLDAETIDAILEAARLAPSSPGLQPYHIFSISNPEIKSQLQPLAYGQPQIVESSHVLVFASWSTIPDEKVDAVYAYTNAKRGISNEATAATVEGLKQLYNSFTEDEQYHHTAKQAHIGFAMAIAAAAELGVDATPMEGFDKNAVDELLKLCEKGLKSVVLLALGKRKEEGDWLLPLKKVKQPYFSFGF